MIYIREDKTKKLPGETALFVKFDYNADVLEIIKSFYSRSWNKKELEWEIPISCLSQLIQKVNPIDTIDLTLLENKNADTTVPEFMTTFKTTPYDYQIDGIKYGLTHDKWLLLDAPGLGKTLQILYLAQELKARGEIEHCLIVCGLNTLKSNWKREVQKHTNLTCRILGEKVSRKGKVTIGGVSERLTELKSPIKEFIVITNVETLRNDEVVKAIEKGPNHFDMIAADEVHIMKNPNSQQGKNFLKLKSAKYKIAMTGTLLLNSPVDAYMPLKWIGAERSNFSTYKGYYCIYGGQFGYDLLGYRNLKELKSQINNYSLRRDKTLLNLPPKTVIDEYVDMADDQQTFYTNIVNGITSDVNKVYISDTSILSMVTRLRQATACPSVLTTEKITPSKVVRAMELTDEILSNGNEKVVIFSTFKETTDVLFNELRRYNPVLCTGNTADSDIQMNIERFQTDPNCKVFIGTWQKCGTGITLTAASNMIFIDTPWTAGVYEQAQDRIHRIGTYNPVTIYNLICNGTIDERVLELLKSKEAISDYIVDNKVSSKTIDILRKVIEEL